MKEMFGPDEINKMVQERLNSGFVNIPSGHKAAVFAYAGTDGVHGGFAFKTDNGWQVDGDIHYLKTQTTEGGLSAGLNIIKTF